jgi:hypothetical protein
MSRPVLIALSVAGVLLLGLCGAGGWMLLRIVDFPSVAGRAEEAEAAARQAGLPWTAEDLRPPEPVPDAQNAATDLAALHEAFVRAQKDPAVRTRDRDRASRDPEVLARHVRDYAEVLAAAERMAAKPALDMNRRWEIAPVLEFPEYESLRAAARALQARANLRILRGDLQGALADTVRIRRLARLAAQEPEIMSLLTGIAMHAIAGGPEEGLAAAWAAQPVRLASLDAAIRQNGPPSDILPALRGEFHRSLAGLRNAHLFEGMEAAALEGEEPKAPDPALLRREGWPPGLSRRAIMVRVVEAWTRAWPELVRRAGDPMQQEEVLQTMAQQLGEGMGLSGMAAAIYMPMPEAYGAPVAKAQARDGALRGLIAALRARAATGGWPASLAEAGFEDADPFGRPYVLKASGGTALVYSLGLDGQDDGGMTLLEARRARPEEAARYGASHPQEPHDIPARFPPAPRPAR